MSLKGLNLATSTRLPAPRIIPKASKEFEKIVESETREADRLIAETDKMIKSTPNESPVAQAAPPEDEQNISESDDKLSRLVDDDFPFDDTQLTAIYGLVQQQYGVMIGAAGTGKTTTTKKLVDMLRDGLDDIDVSQYWKRGSQEGDDEYETPERLIPSIAMVSFTGRATQMIKKNFPRDWHGNIMTIHRALGFYPEFYQDLDVDSGELVGKRKFVPAYTEENQMPWDIIIVDEAGMLGLELWHQLWAATKSTARIILIGDINQLPPTHGKSILGFALAKWPTWELTHVHRQQGANNSIVDNAHRILKGLRPVSDSPTPLSVKSDKEMMAALNYMVRDDSWRFIMVEVPEEHRMASLRIRQVLQLVQGKIYEPNRDVLITPINGFEQTAPGYSLGQEPLNQELVVKLNSKSPRYLIDAGREKQNFAVGDKVMATVNDYEAGITNGMTGIIQSIQENGAYIGDTRRWGLITEVNEYLSGLTSEEDDDIDFSLDEMVSDSQAGMDELRKREKKDAGPASHLIEVQFGEGEHAFNISFATKSSVGSLRLAYAATCHKMQGGECPLVFGIVHQANKRPLNREWTYTYVTRASQRCVMFYTKQGLGFALGKQTIKGANLKAKIQTFVELTKVGLVGASVRVKIPEPASLTTDVTAYEPRALSADTVSPIQNDGEQDYIDCPHCGAGRIYSIECDSCGKTADDPKKDRVVFRDRVIIVERVRDEQPKASAVVDCGELTPKEKWDKRVQAEMVKIEGKPKALALAPPKPDPQLVSQWGAYHTAVKLGHVQLMANRLLAYTPAPKTEERPKPTNPAKPLSIGQLLMKGRKS